MEWDERNIAPFAPRLFHPQTPLAKTVPKRLKTIQAEKMPTVAMTAKK